MLLKKTPQPEPTNYSTITTRDHYTIKVSPDDHENLNRFSWFIRWSSFRPYVCRKIIIDKKEVLIRMHRQVTNCQFPNEVHHINHNTLDNRSENLLCCSKLVHRMHHGKA
jgi:hypothetical protein